MVGGRKTELTTENIKVYVCMFVCMCVHACGTLQVALCGVYTCAYQQLL